MAEKVSFIYNGTKYTRELESPNVARIQALNDADTDRIAAQLRKQGKNSVPRAMLDAIHRRNVAKERAERVQRAKEAVERENGPNKLADDGAPNPTTPNGGVKSGDPGISQRRTTPAPNLAGAQKEDPAAKGNSPTVKTNQDAEQDVRNLADAINQIAMERDKNSEFISRRIPHPSTDKDFLGQAAEVGFQVAGASDPDAQIANFFSRHDRFEASMVPPNSEFAGYTFITRPKLNLSVSNLVSDDKFTALKSSNVIDFGFALKCFLDTKFAAESNLARQCPLIDLNNPYNTLLCNAIQSITGYVDPTLEVETSPGGYFSEDQTVAIGGDRLTKTYELNVQCRDIPGGPVAALFDYWCQYIADLTDGTVNQYADAIDANRLDYTVSIYRFITDRTRRFITKWSKATGCFPVTAPVGVPFNKNQGEYYITASKEFTVNFKANRLEYNKHIIINEFNTLVRRYVGWPSDPRSMPTVSAFSHRPQNNFSGLPYIRIGDMGYELVFLASNNQTDVSKLSNTPISKANRI